MAVSSEIYSLSLANIQINVRIIYPQTICFLQDYLDTLVADMEPIGLGSYEEGIILRDYEEGQRGSIAERKILAVLVSDALLPYDRLIFHSVAFSLNGRTWLLAAPSGVGKTTQYRNMKVLYPDKIEVLCGDNPVLDFSNVGSVWVHPSPWKGKEGYGCERVSILRGIILLEQASQNSICHLEKSDAVVPIFHQFNTFLKKEQQVHQLAALERRLLDTVPVFKFCNTGDLSSSQLLFEFINGFCGH